MSKIIASLIAAATILLTGIAHAETCNIIDGAAVFGTPCKCPPETTKKALPGGGGYYICDDGTGAADELAAGKVCCTTESGSGYVPCAMIGAKYQWMPRDQCRQFGLGSCPASSCKK